MPTGTTLPWQNRMSAAWWTGIREQQPGRRLETRGRELVLDRGIARELGHAHEAQERKRELVELRHLRVSEDRRALRVDADRQVIRDQLLDIVGQRGGAVTIGDRLVVGDEHDRLDAEVLKPHPVEQRPEVMAEMQRTGRSISGENAELSLGRGGSQLPAAPSAPQRRRATLSNCDPRSGSGTCACLLLESSSERISACVTNDGPLWSSPLTELSEAALGAQPPRTHAFTVKHHGKW